MQIIYKKLSFLTFADDRANRGFNTLKNQFLECYQDIPLTH